MIGAGASAQGRQTRPARSVPVTTISTLSADKPLLPVGDGRLGTIALRLLGGVRLDLMMAFLAPDDQPHAGGGSGAERHWRTRLGFHRRADGAGEGRTRPARKILMPSTPARYRRVRNLLQQEQPSVDALAVLREVVCAVARSAVDGDAGTLGAERH
jgi:hypothetical protein